MHHCVHHCVHHCEANAAAICLVPSAASQGAPWVRSPIAPRSADFNLLEGQLAAIRSQLTIASKASLRAES